MTTDIAVRVSNLSKCYQIYATPRDRLKQFVMPRLQRLAGRPPKQYFSEFWALKDVSFEIKKGETVGIIGRNGSGKSTLLQMICGTLNPSSGSVQTNGRIAALLELGSGFNPEFTGRENVYMNASVLGLSKEETDARLDDIVAFADIGAFIDQPVKTYSSGMYVRLAFAVAVNVQPDILIVDEALSVGDIAFQNRCITRIKAIRAAGTTVLFVSHDLSTLQMICNRAIWLKDGSVADEGEPVRVCQEYYVFMTGTVPEKPNQQHDLIPQQMTGAAKFIQFKLDNLDANKHPTYLVGGIIGFQFAIEATENLDKMVFTLSVYGSEGDWVIGQTSREAEVFWPSATANEKRRGTLKLSPNCLAPGNYRAACAVYSADLSLCYAMTETTVSFAVRSDFPTWGKFVHPCTWVALES